MSKNHSGPVDSGSRPQIFDDLGLPDTVQPPEKMVGVYRVAEDETTGETVYKRDSILTSEGWIPPAKGHLANLTMVEGESPNDIEALSKYPATKRNLTAIDPRELRSKLESSDDEYSGKITQRKVEYAPDPRRCGDKVEYYIPDSLSTEQLATYLRYTVHPALNRHKRGANTDQPSRDEIVNILSESYGISADEADLTIEKAIESSLVSESDGVLHAE